MHNETSDSEQPSDRLRRALTSLEQDQSDPYDLLLGIEDAATRYILAWHTLRCALLAMVGYVAPGRQRYGGIGLVDVAVIVCSMLVCDDMTNLLAEHKPDVRAMLAEALAGGVVVRHVSRDEDEAVNRVGDLMMLCPVVSQRAFRDALVHLTGGGR